MTLTVGILRASSRALQITERWRHGNQNPMEFVYVEIGDWLTHKTTPKFHPSRAVLLCG